MTFQGNAHTRSNGTKWSTFTESLAFMKHKNLKAI